MFCIASSVLAATPTFIPLDEVQNLEAENEVSAFQSKMVVRDIPIKVPTVVEVPFLSPGIERRGFMVLENETGRTIPSFLHETYMITPTPVSATVESQERFPGVFTSLVDGNDSTGELFELPVDREGAVTIILSTNVPIVTSGLRLTLERNVSLPTFIEVRAFDTYGERVLLSRTRMFQERVSFIPTTVSGLIVELEYAQPLKINELTLVQDNPESSVTRGLRFLAQPNMTYTIYGNADRSVQTASGESGDLRTDAGVLTLPAHSFVANILYRPADVDEDGVRDVADNCVLVANVDQTDIDGNGRGDVCDDFDRDGVTNLNDNCKNMPNTNQDDVDHDGVGDVCDTEESRLTERLPWVPWAGMGIAAFVLIGLFAVVAMRPMKSGVTPDSDISMQPPTT